MELSMRDNKYDIRNDKEYLKTYIYFNPTKFDKTKNVKENIDNLDAIKILLENDDKFVVDHNNTDVNLNNTDVNLNSYQNVKKYIFDIILKDIQYLCEGLDRFYIVDSLFEVDAVVIIRSSINPLPDVPIFGFALIKFNEKKNSIYIDVICSDKRTKCTGKFLLEQIQDICRTVFMTDIHLQSVQSAIPFYEKYGFTKSDKLCKNMCLMTKSLKTKISIKKKKQITKQKSANNKIGGKKRKTKKLIFFTRKE
jgi:hypothetical protein